MVRFSLSYYYFKEALSLKQKKENKYYFLSIFLLTSSLFLALGFYTSFVSFFLLFYEFFNLIKKFLEEEKKYFTLEIFKISLISVLIFIGPGKISLDRFLNVRF